MQYQCTIDINGPRDRVTALFDDPDNLMQWQDGLQSFEHFEGEFGAVGSRSRIRYKMGKREIEMIETLEEHAMPDRMVAVYETKGVWNRNVNTFTDLGEATRWDMDCDFRCSGFLKVMAFVAPGMFRKQTEKMMQDFKRFAEAEMG